MDTLKSMPPPAVIANLRSPCVPEYFSHGKSLYKEANP